MERRPAALALMDPSTTWWFATASRPQGSSSDETASKPRWRCAESRTRSRRWRVSAAAEHRICRMGRALARLARAQALDCRLLPLDDRPCKGDVRRPARPTDRSRGHRTLQPAPAGARLLALHAGEAPARTRRVPAGGRLLPVRGVEPGTGAAAGAEASPGTEGGGVLRERRTSSPLRAPPRASPIGRFAWSRSRRECGKANCWRFAGATSISSRQSCAFVAATRAAQSARRRTASVETST